MAGNWYPHHFDVIEQHGEVPQERQSTNINKSFSGNKNSQNSQNSNSSSGPWLNRAISASDIETSAQESSPSHVLKFQLDKPPSQASSIPSSPAKTSPSSEELEFTHPRTRRPARQLLSHEKSLLDEFFMMKNISTTQPTPHEAEEWRLKLPVYEIEEWNDFILTRQSEAEAKLRKDSIEAHISRINEIKESEELALRRTARQAYLDRRYGKADQGIPKKDSKKQTAIKRKKADCGEDGDTYDEEAQDFEKYLNT